jgi:trigger factor
VKSSVEALEGNKVKVYVEVEEHEFERDIDRAFKAIAKEINLPGFRAGKVPRRVLEARIGIGPAREQAIRDAVPDYLSRAIAEHDVDLIATPEVEITDGHESGPVEFDATCEIRPTITLDGYADLELTLPAVEVTDDDVEGAQNEELAKQGALEPVDRPIESGDFVTLDLRTTRDGEEVVGLNTEDWSYEVGQGWVTEDFDDHLIGASEGDVVTFTSTPKETDEEADFEVTITAVQSRVLPELTDEWVSENLAEHDTVEEWTEALRIEIAERKVGAVRQQIIPLLNEQLAGLVDLDPPKPMVDSEVNQQVQGTVRQLQAAGIDVDQWLQMIGQQPEEFIESMRPQAEAAVKVDLALRAIADAEQLDVEPGELDNEYARMAMQFGQKAKEIRKAYEANNAVPSLLASIRKSKALDWLVHNVTFVDENGIPLDRDVVLGHTHDEHGNHIDPAAQPTAEHDETSPGDVGESVDQPADDPSDQPADQPADQQGDE